MSMYKEAEEIGVYDLWQLNSRRVELCKAYLDRWNASELDVILCSWDLSSNDDITDAVSKVLQLLTLLSSTGISHMSATQEYSMFLITLLFHSR
jgi:hypothetical protein